VNLTPMRVVAREYDLLEGKRRITVELANGRVLTFRVAGDDARFFDDVSERDVVQALRPLVPEEWSMNSDETKVL
jgi:hypothetical protein